MATLRDAEAGRRENEDRFSSLGAHAIEIQPRAAAGGYELIVHFAGTPPTSVPRSVVVASGERAASVPVRTVVRPD